MPGRPNRPLFELLRDSAREAPARPAPAPPPPVAPAQSPAAARPAPVRVEATASPHPSHDEVSSARQPAHRQFIPISQNAIYIGIAAALVFLVIAYAAGFTIGKNRAGDDYRQRLSSQTALPGVTEPGTTPGAGSAAPLGARRSDPGASPAADRPATPVLVPSADGRILSSQGNLASDPRQPGMNYLSLAILNAQDTQSAIEFLARNGLQTIGVPLVDPKAAKGNNPPLYQLVAVQGITSAEYRDRAPARVSLEGAVERLGRAWQKDHKGSSNFAKHGWAKLD